MQTFKQLRKNCKGHEVAQGAPRVALVGDTATQFLSEALRGEAIRRGYDINLFEAEYNQVERQFLDPSSELYTFNADYIVLFQSTHKWGELHSSLDEDGQCRMADQRLDFIASICHNPQFVGKKLICMNYPEIEDTVFGSYANQVESSFTWQVRKLNYGLMQLARDEADLFVCDIAGLQNKLGRDKMFASNVYVSTEMVLSVDALPYVASRVIDIIRSVSSSTLTTRFGAGSSVTTVWRVSSLDMASALARRLQSSRCGLRNSSLAASLSVWHRRTTKIPPRSPSSNIPTWCLNWTISPCLWPIGRRR